MLEGIADVTLPSIAAADTMWTPGLAPAAAAGSQTLSRARGRMMLLRRRRRGLVDSWIGAMGWDKKGVSMSSAVLGKAGG